MTSPDILRRLETAIGRAQGVNERAGYVGTTDLNVGSMRLGRWLNSPAFSERLTFGHFLQSNRLTEATLVRYLGLTPCVEPNSADAKAWIAAVGETAEPQGGNDQLGVGAFLNVVQPLVLEASSRVQSVMDALNCRAKRLVIEPGVLGALIDALREQLLLVIIKPVTLELQIARMSGTLDGETSAERFRNFAIDLCRQETRGRLFSQYPVMLKHCLRIRQQWVDSTKEFLERTVGDLPSLERTFGVGAPLVFAQLSSGDAHREGRRVIVATFSDGRRLIYKPRPMKAAVRFQELLDWLNAKGLTPALRTFRIHDVESYGWSEFVETANCQSSNDVAAFYKRMGALLAVLHVVRATDAHFENVIANGPHPVLVDLETVVQPNIIHDEAGVGGHLFRDAATQSVLSVGLLPSPIRVGDQLVDMSGLGARPNQPTPLQTMGFDAVGTDAMCVTKVQFLAETSSHLPMLDGQYQLATAYIEPLIAGFRDAYHLIMECASELSSPTGRISAFQDCEVRVLLRPTATYASLLQESHHPMALSDGTETDRVLGQIWSGVTSSRIWQKSVMYEFTQLQRGDVPFFVCSASGTTLVSGDGHRLEALLLTSGMDAVRTRLTRMSEVDLSLQEWIIRASMASLGETRGDSAGMQYFPDHGSAIADKAMSALRSTCIVAGNRTSWPTLAPTTRGHADVSLDYLVTEVGIDLYDGLAGIAFFLFAFAKHTNDEHALHLGGGVLNELDARLKGASVLQPFGAFTGLAGILYAYSHIATWFPDKNAELQARAAFLMPQIASKLDDDRTCDLLNGRAGAILCLLAAHSVWADGGYMDIAVRCGGDLVGCLGQAPYKETTDLEVPYRRGLSHGYAGVAMALAALGAAMGAKIFTKAALELTLLEESLVASGDWTDPGDEHHVGQVTWCHGAPGIAMARLVTLGHTHEPSVEDEARKALTKCLDAPPIDNESLCHGSLGNLDALAHAVAAFPSERFWTDQVRRESSRIEGVIAAHGLRCARPHYVTVPGLMTGLSGIGYGSLRLANPTTFPSVLTLASPRRFGTAALT